MATKKIDRVIETNSQGSTLRIESICGEHASYVIRNTENHIVHYANNKHYILRLWRERYKYLVSRYNPFTDKVETWNTYYTTGETQ